jgi:hypothetical protein
MGPDVSDLYHPFLHVSDDGSSAGMVLLIVVVFQEDGRICIILVGM